MHAAAITVTSTVAMYSQVIDPVVPGASPQRENPANMRGVTSVPPKSRDIDWIGWVRWLSESHGIDVEGAWTYVMEALDHLKESGFSSADAYTKLDTLLRVARKQRKPQPLGFIQEEIRKFVIRRDGAPSRSNY